jgi:rubrerythrin
VCCFFLSEDVPLARDVFVLDLCNQRDIFGGVDTQLITIGEYMMQVETLKDILQWTKEFHQHLSQRLSRGVDKNTDERARMMLAYLADHEKSLAKVLKNFVATGDEHALNTWCYEYVSKYPIVQNRYADASFADLDATQIMDVIVDQHQQVIEMYRYLAGRAEISAAREMLESLLSLEEHEMMRMVQSANRLEDI